MPRILNRHKLFILLVLGILTPVAIYIATSGQDLSHSIYNIFATTAYAFSGNPSQSTNNSPADLQVVQPTGISNNITTNAVSGSSTVAADLSAGTIDQQAYMLDRFFESQSSPLAGQGSTFMKYCQEYGVNDCLFIPAISYAESNYCKSVGALENHNCWGFGGAGANRMKFQSFDDAIKLITYRLITQYGPAFFANPRTGASTYCGSGPGCENWADAVISARNDIINFAIRNGFKWQ